MSESEPPRISIVTPSYNQAEYVRQTIESVLSQDYPNLDYSILDAGSTDGSAEIIAEYASSLSYWRSHADDGQSAALREGFDRADGEILTWLNSDDLLTPGTLDRVAEVWSELGPGVIVAGACQLLDGHEPSGIHYPSFQNQFNTATTMPLERIFDMARHWFPGEFFYQPEVFFPAAAYHAIGGVDPSIHLAMDYDLWVRFALQGTPIVVVDDVLAQYREHDGQKTASKQPLYDEMIETANRYLAMDSNPLPARKRWTLRWSNSAARARGYRFGWRALRHLSGDL